MGLSAARENQFDPHHRRRHRGRRRRRGHRVAAAVARRRPTAPAAPPPPPPPPAANSCRSSSRPRRSAAQAAGGEVQRERPRWAASASSSRCGDELRRRRERDRRGRLQPDVWSPAGSFWGRLLNLQADKRLRRRRQPVDRAHAAGDRDVGADGAGARLAAQAGRLRGHRAARDRAERLGGRGQAAVRALQVRAHEPGLLDLGRRGGRRLLLRVRRQAGGPDRRRRRPRRRRRSRRSSARSSTTATRRCSSRTSCARAASPTPRRWRWRRRRSSTSTAAAARSTKLVALYPRTARSSATRRTSCSTRLGDAPPKRQAAARSRSSWPTRSRPTWPGATASGPATRGQAGRPDHRGQRRRSGAAAARRSRCPSRKVLNRVSRPGGGTASPRDVDARAGHLGLDERGGQARPRQGRGCRPSSARSRRRTRRADQVLREVTPLEATAPFAQQPRARSRSRRGHHPRGRHRVYDATRRAVDASRRTCRPRPHQRGRGPHRRRGHHVVISASEVIDASGRRAKGDRGVRVFTIAYGSDAKASELDRFAAASGGRGAVELGGLRAGTVGDGEHAHGVALRAALLPEAVEDLPAADRRRGPRRRRRPPR